MNSSARSSHLLCGQSRAAATAAPPPARTAVLHRPSVPPSVMASHLHLLGVGSRDSSVPPSALLFFEHARYLFGAGEGTQRLATEAQAKMSKMKHIFITRLHSDTVG